MVIVELKGVYFAVLSFILLYIVRLFSGVPLLPFDVRLSDV